MAFFSSPSSHSLALNHPILDATLVRRLSPVLAFRYHALPLAEENGHVTVAMAEPDNVEARQAVAAALGAKLYVVRSDAAVIDALLSEVWPAESPQPLRLLVCVPASPVTAKLQAYAQRIGNLLHSHLIYFPLEAGTGPALKQLAEEAGQGYDLVAVGGEPDQSLIERLLWKPVANQIVDRMPTSLLIVRQPRWPLRRILLLIRGEEADEGTLDWVVRLAQPSGAAVTVLAVAPEGPLPYSRESRALQGLAALLSMDTPAGKEMRHVAQRLTNAGIPSTLRLRQGSPVNQVRDQVAEEEYDLIVAAAEPSDGWLRRLLGDLIGSVLRWVDRPVLIVRP
jgi:nucleotide-binding universal stress UspA family protein